jgi:hypothetical protein
VQLEELHLGQPCNPEQNDNDELVGAKLGHAYNQKASSGGRREFEPDWQERRRDHGEKGSFDLDTQPFDRKTMV